MNIFVLDSDPVICARYHSDAHVRKMAIEYAQILSTVQRQYGNTNTRLYKKTHEYRKCVKWAGLSEGNYQWLYELWTSVCYEYTLRYDKIHHCERLLKTILKDPPEGMEDLGITMFIQDMRPEFHMDDPIEGYRNYYVKSKKNFSSWLYPRDVPEWYLEKMIEVIKYSHISVRMTKIQNSLKPFLIEENRDDKNVLELEYNIKNKQGEIFFSLSYYPKHILFSDFVVYPKRKGLGTYIMNMIVELSNKYLIPIELRIADKNLIPFYEKFGFQLDQRSGWRMIYTPL